MSIHYHFCRNNTNHIFDFSVNDKIKKIHLSCLRTAGVEGRFYAMTSLLSKWQVGSEILFAKK